MGDAFRVLKPGGRFAVSDIVFDGELSDLPIDEAQLRGALSWAACFAGALTMHEYRTLLEAAGFGEVKLDVTQRYSVADLEGYGEAEGLLATLPAEAVAALDGKVTSCAITAWKPV